MATYTSNKPAVRDSFDDDDVSDDVDDEVFIRDGRNGFKVDEERGVKRPLMAPRRKTKSGGGSQFHPEICKQPQCRTFCVPCCYGFLALVALFGLVTLVVVLINMFPFPLDRIRIWTENMVPHEKLDLPCTDLKTRNVWVKSFPKLTAEAALKLNDVNKDGIQDIIIGYGTGADELDLGEEVCPSYMPGVPTCLGGAVALDGAAGTVLWQHWTHRSVLFVDCSTDVNQDKTNDCVISGKGGVLSVLNGGDGSVVWELKRPPSKDEVDVYAVQYINDVDFDLVPDILAAHSSIVAGEAQGHLVILSGASGRVVSQAATPGHLPVYSHPQVMVGPDGTDMLLFTTGSSQAAGGLYIVSLHSLVVGNISQSVQLVKGGVNEAPVLVDINRDGSEDIVVISEGLVTAINGVTLEQIWNVSAQSLRLPTSFENKFQILNSPTPAYFNDDDVPDFLFTHVVGSSYPEFFFSLTSVVDGRTGQPLLDQPMTASAFVDVPGLSLSMAGRGNDFFLHWAGVCLGHENSDLRFSFLNSTPIRQRAKADLCRLRFNSSLDLRLYAFSEHTAPPGLLVYSSDKRWREDNNASLSSAVGSADHQVTSGLPQQKQPQPMPPTQQLNSFHHTGDSVEYLKASHHNHPHSKYHRQQFGGSDELPVPVNLNQAMEEYERLREWHPQESAYGRRYQNLDVPGYGPMLPEGMGGDLETGYSPEGDEGAMFPPNTMGGDRVRRSVIHRLLPHVGTAGVLAPALEGSGVDLVVTTHWLPSADVYIRLPRDEQCILERMSRIVPEKYDDLEALRATVEEECLLSRGASRAPPSPLAVTSQLTVSRIAVACVCDKVAPGEECAHAMLLERQSWPQRGPNTYFKNTFGRPALA